MDHGLSRSRGMSIRSTGAGSRLSVITVAGLRNVSTCVSGEMRTIVISDSPRVLLLGFLRNTVLGEKYRSMRTRRTNFVLVEVEQVGLRGGKFGSRFR